MKRHGFVKQSGTWYHDSPETISVANLQKSNFGPLYYVNLGIWCKALGNATAPKEEQCPVRVRLGSLVDESVSRAFDMREIDITDESRTKMIGDCVTNVVVPFLRSLETTDQLKHSLKDKKIPGVMVYRALNEYLGLN